MTTQARPDDKTDPVAEAVAQAMVLAKGDRAHAIRLLEGRVRNDPSLRERLIAPLIRKACADVIGEAIRKGRSQAWNRPRIVQPNEQRDRVVALATGTLLMFRLPTPGNKPLGEATRAEIAEAVRFYEAQSDDMAFKARWLSLVAQHVTSGKTVRDVMSEERLLELKREASRADR